MSAEKPLRAWGCRHEDRHCDDDECRCTPPPEKPLHVQVAEALGRKPRLSARYDTNWAATGPLIEKYGIELICNGSYDGPPASEWTATGNSEEPDGLFMIDASTPLLAVCHLILALKAAGKLDKQ